MKSGCFFIKVVPNELEFAGMNGNGEKREPTSIASEFPLHR